MNWFTRINDFLRPYLMNSWMGSAEFCAQSAHMGWGAAVALASWTMFEILFYVWVFWVIYTMYAAAKEFWFDVQFETDAVQTRHRVVGDTYSGGLLDFSMYQAGFLLGVAWLIVAWLIHGGTLTMGGP